MAQTNKPQPVGPEVKSVFGEIIDAKELGDTERVQTLLAQADPAVRHAVEELLRAHEQAAGVLLDETLHGEEGDSDAGAGTPSIEGYEIGDEIGHGGFGIVYKAHQRVPIERDVAVKILRRELVSDEAISRFRAESTLLARMNHESIARVFDAGLTDQGQPFAAMELIDGQPITEACNTLRLNTRQRVELVARVCDAVHHAHQRAVIHRDLKPANILVERCTQGPRPRVIDFGIAKLLEHDDQSLQTRESVRLGTPRYMSPEQRSGGVGADTRVDVYALGAILCELLAGDVPTQGAGQEEPDGTHASRISRPSKIASEQTHRTAAHPKALRGDLDRIVLKACATDPELRYPSALAMGDDLRRYLEGRAVVANPPSVLYLSRKFVRRHRASVSLAGVLGIALMVAIGIAGLKWREAGRERDLARASSERVSFIGDFLLEMLLLSVDHNVRGAPPILAESEMRDIADRAAEGLADDPEHMLPMLAGIGRFQAQSGYAEAGIETMRKALDFAIQYHGVPSDEVIELRLRLHDTLWGHGIDGWKEEIALADRESAQLYADDDPRRLRVLQRADSSIENLERIIALYEDMPGVDPADRYEALFALNMKQRFSNHPSKQLETTRKLYEVAKANFPSSHNAVIDSMALYGEAMTTYAPSEEAAVLLKEAYNRAVPKYGFDHFTTESIRRALARVYGTLGRPNEGIPYALADIESAERANGSESIQYANALYELGRLYQYAERFEEAKEILEQTLKLKKKHWPQGHAQITTTQVVLAQVEYMLGHDERAEQLCVEILGYLQDYRSARTYVVTNGVRIAIRQRSGDTDGVEALRTQTRAHLKQLGLGPAEIEDILKK